NQGDEFLENDEFDSALEQYCTALELLPSPKCEWEAAGWIYTAIGDVHFSRNDFPKARDSFAKAIGSMVGNPYIYLRLGESHFELGDKQSAGDNLARAYMVGGKEIFKDEPSKYFDFLKTVLEPPVGQSDL